MDTTLAALRAIEADIRAGRLQEAAAALTTLGASAPHDARVYVVGALLAQAAGNPQYEVVSLQRAHALRPEDPGIALGLGVALGKQGRYAEAEPHWRRVLAASPDEPFALAWLGTCLIGLERKDEARAPLEHADALLPGNPTLQFYLAIARGETPTTQPGALTQGLFDEYASRFDMELVGRLKYRVPRRVAEVVLARPQGRDIGVLDLGCGTGLLGLYLGRVAGEFVGVDLSPKMLEQAARHGIYTELREGDLLDALRQSAPQSFDCIVANDVFIYLGDISVVVPAAFRVLRSGGVLVFSCEAATAEEGALALRPSKRYAHSRDSVERMCRDAGFARCDIEMLDLRLDANVPIAGFIAIAGKA